MELYPNIVVHTLHTPPVYLLDKKGTTTAPDDLEAAISFATASIWGRRWKKKERDHANDLLHMVENMLV